MYNSHIRPDLRSSVRVPISDRHVISISVNRPRFREYLSGATSEWINDVSCIDQRFHLEQFIDIKLLGVEGNTEQWLSLTKPIAFCQNGKDVWAVIVSREDKIKTVLSPSMFQDAKGDNGNGQHIGVADSCVTECSTLELPAVPNGSRHPSIRVLEGLSYDASASILSVDSRVSVPIINSNLRAESPECVSITNSNLRAESPEFVPIINSNLRAKSPECVQIINNNLRAEYPEFLPIINSKLRAESPEFVPIGQNSSFQEASDVALLATNIVTAESPALVPLATNIVTAESPALVPLATNIVTAESPSLVPLATNIVTAESLLEETVPEYENDLTIESNKHERSSRRQHLLNKSRVVFLRKLLVSTQV